MRYCATVAYDGTQFHGWQRQGDLRCVQTEIEAALFKIVKAPVEIHASGRTDAKVHALGQTFHFDSELDIPEAGWIQALNTVLPDDIYIVKIEAVADSFHARHSVKRKTYEYRVNIGSYDVFRRNYELHVPYKLNLKEMTQVPALFLGKHDFTSFNATELEVMPYQVREIYEFSITQTENHLIFKITGNGFLRYMVRMLVAACLTVGQGRFTIKEIEEMLAIRNKRVFPVNVSAHGLYLVKVDYF